jgi:hypothetical protein
MDRSAKEYRAFIDNLKSRLRLQREVVRGRILEDIGDFLQQFDRLKANLDENRTIISVFDPNGTNVDIARFNQLNDELRLIERLDNLDEL